MACMSRSIMRMGVERLSLAKDGVGKDRLIFSSPASPIRQNEHPYGRYNLTVRLSYDDPIAGRFHPVLAI